jgi:small subunit ribosomal protein S16
MVIIRLARNGKSNDPVYRIVATEKTKKLSGKFLDTIGYWHPKSKQLSLDKEKVTQWKAKGAQVSVGVSKLLS